MVFVDAVLFGVFAGSKKSNKVKPVNKESNELLDICYLFLYVMVDHGSITVAVANYSFFKCNVTVTAS